MDADYLAPPSKPVNPPVKVRRIDFSPDEWLAGTISLSHAERSVFITICAAIWSLGRPAPIDHVRRLCPGKGFGRALRGLMSAGKVTIEGGCISNSRALSEHCRAVVRTLLAREHGAKGGRSNGLDEAGGSGSAKANHQLSTINHHIEESPSVSPPGRKPKRKAPAYAIAETWQPDEQDRDYARSKGHDDRWIEEQAELFRDHHLKHGKLFCDWHACWRTWVQNWAKFNSNGKAASNGHDRTRVPLDSTPDPVAKESARLRIYAQLGIEC